MAKKIRPLGDRVIVEALTQETSKSGIINGPAMTSCPDRASGIQKIQVSAKVSAIKIQNCFNDGVLFLIVRSFD